MHRLAETFIGGSPSDPGIKSGGSSEAEKELRVSEGVQSNAPSKAAIKTTHVRAWDTKYKDAAAAELAGRMMGIEHYQHTDGT
eukprot:gene8032-1264_t